MQPIGRYRAEDAEHTVFAAHVHQLVALVGRRTGILEYGRAVRAAPQGRFQAEDQVVGLRALERQCADLRFRPVHPVRGFGVGEHRLEVFGLRLLGVVMRLVVEPEAPLVLKQGAIDVDEGLPRTIGRHQWRCVDARRVHGQADAEGHLPTGYLAAPGDAVPRLDEVPVHKDLLTITNIERHAFAP